ncbi:nickel pincer cofactor biosynthesis protein LarC [Synechococcus sp. PCC 7502]|uniref:nickel pincer cofactor biosynthesis protein LarC n=1 Tax=Synechococcus sp. PCC 7502 TaxID=1173263 RepID=UPI00059DD247
MSPSASISKKIAYFDCAVGIAGDMCLGALVSAGVPLEYFTEIIDRLGIGDEVKLRSELVNRGGQEAVKVHVDIRHHGHHHRHLPEIETIIKSAQLEPLIEKNSLEIFQNLAIAEGKVHGIPPEKVHFHEVGALDAIADIVCTCAGLAWLGVEQVFCSALPTGGGFVTCEHGQLPVPVPAVLKLWEMFKVPVFSNGIDRELVTPTGAAIAVSLSAQFGTIPAMSISKIGLGAGTRELAIPNIFRLWIGESTDQDKKKQN